MGGFPPCKFGVALCLIQSRILLYRRGRGQRLLGWKSPTGWSAVEQASSSGVCRRERGSYLTLFETSTDQQQQRSLRRYREMQFICSDNNEIGTTDTKEYIRVADASDELKVVNNHGYHVYGAREPTFRSGMLRKDNMKNQAVYHGGVRVPLAFAQR